MSGKIFCKIQSLHLYPIKSAGGLSVPEVVFDAWGLQRDREFMVVDDSGRFQTRRETPQMAEIETEIGGENLRVRIQGQDYFVPLRADTTPATEKVRVWKSEVEADLVEHPGLNEALSKLLARPVHLVRYGRHSQREVKKSGKAWGRQFRFADSANVLVTSEESLHDLNGRLTSPIPMGRFRPNIVVSGDGPWAEDRWALLRSPQGLTLTIVGGCGRCQIINQDVATGETSSKEPLQRLAEFRRFGSSVDFGVHAVHTLPSGLAKDADGMGMGPVGTGLGLLKVGMDLEIEINSLSVV